MPLLPQPSGDDASIRDSVPFQVRIDGIERHINIALLDIAELRKMDRVTKVKARNQCVLLEAALQRARFYTQELDRSLEAYWQAAKDKPDTSTATDDIA